MNSARQRRRTRKADIAPVGATSDNACPTAGSADFIDETIAVWQPMAKHRLTREDGRQIAENMSGFFRILQEWDRAERKARKAAERKRPDGTVAAPAPTP